MKTKAISEICLVNPRIPASLSSQKSRDVDFIPMANVSEDGRIIINAPRKLHEVQKGYTYFQNGDVIVAKITPCMENGKAAYIRNLPHEVGFGSTEFHVLRPQVGLDPAYLFHMVWNPFFRREARRNMTGTAGQQRVPASFFERFKIPLPPLPEQRRIADILDKADAIRRKRQEAVTLLSKATSSLFFQLFGDPLFNPKNWNVVPLGDVCDKITDGVHFKPKYQESGIPFISVKDITTGKLHFDDTKYVSEEDHKVHIRACHPEFGDVLLTKVGATYGRPALVDTERPFSLYVSVALIKPKRRLIDPVFLKEVLASDELKRQADRSIKGAGVPDLHLVEIRKFRIPLPPLDVQQAFVAKTNAIHSLEATLQEAANEKDYLFNSLVQRAFRGEL
jgi:type I restriction enzyme S subunit